MGKDDVTQIRTAVRRLSGQPSGAPTGDFDQSRPRMSVTISRIPGNRSSRERGRGPADSLAISGALAGMKSAALGPGTHQSHCPSANIPRAPVANPSDDFENYSRARRTPSFFAPDFPVS